MWMAYVTPTKVVDFVTAINYLHQQFSNLAFDVHHKAIYGMGTFLSKEECNEFEGRDDTATFDDLLDSKIGLIDILNLIKGIQFGSFIHVVNSSFPQEFGELYLNDDEESKDNDDYADDENEDTGLEK